MEDGKEKLVPVGGTSNFSRTVAKYFDDVVYCEVKNGTHRAASSTTYAHNILTGSRTGVKTEDSKEASLLKIFRNEEPSQEQKQTVVHLQQVAKDIGKEPNK